MKKNTSSNAQDAGHTEGQGRNVPGTGRKGKTNNSQAMGDMMKESPEQKAGNSKNKKRQSNSDNSGPRS